MASIPRRIGVNLASIWLPNSRDFRHDWATIAPRSGHDRGPDLSSIACRSIGDDSPRKELRSRLDRTAIVGSSTSCLRRPMAIKVSGWPRSRDRVDSGFEERPPSDGRRSRSRRCPFHEDQAHQKAPRVAKVASDHGRPMKKSDDRIVPPIAKGYDRPMKIHASSLCHVSTI